jgi:hypothetical protein
MLIASRTIGLKQLNLESLKAEIPELIAATEIELDKLPHVVPGMSPASILVSELDR